VDSVEVVELEKSFWEKETANVDVDCLVAFICYDLVCQIFHSYSLE
jgi:hypothetical protein